MAKKTKTKKVSEETGVEEADLNRLPIEALDKLDALIPDADELLDTPKDKVLLGYHPITGKEVWK